MSFGKIMSLPRKDNNWFGNLFSRFVLKFYSILFPLSPHSWCSDRDQYFKIALTLFMSFHQHQKGLKSLAILGSVCGSVGRAVASDTGGPRFEPLRRQNLWNKKGIGDLRITNPGIKHLLFLGQKHAVASSEASLIPYKTYSAKELVWSTKLLAYPRKWPP